MTTIETEIVTDGIEQLPASDAGPETALVGTRPLRVAVASSNGERIDRHFGQTEDLWVFDVGDAGYKRIDVRNVDKDALGDEDRRQTIYRLVADCKVLLIAKIGVTPQENLAALGVEGIDKHANASVDAALRDVYVAKTNRSSGLVIDTSSFRMLRTVLQASDLERSLDFYTRLLGMAILEKHEHNKHGTVRIFLGYSGDPAGMVLEIVHRTNGTVKSAEREVSGHIVIGVCGISALCDRLSAEGVSMPRPPRAGEQIVACIEDPDGHRIELIETTAS
jgi:lactoylglutathione lyase